MNGSGAVLVTEPAKAFPSTPGIFQHLIQQIPCWQGSLLAFHLGAAAGHMDRTSTGSLTVEYFAKNCNFPSSK